MYSPLVCHGTVTASCTPGATFSDFFPDHSPVLNPGCVWWFMAFSPRYLPLLHQSLFIDAWTEDGREMMGDDDVANVPKSNSARIQVSFDPLDSDDSRCVKL